MKIFNKKLLCVVMMLIVIIAMTPYGYALNISTQDAFAIANKIWQNECSGKKENLTCWNKGEDFASLGIGHFIWYPANQPEKFHQTFPKLLVYLQSQKIEIPSWLKNANGCPWTSREAFYGEINSPRMQELRQFLYDTRQYQALFMAKRLEEVLPKITEGLNAEEKQTIKKTFYRLSEDPKGLYALLDYLNFKGEGTALSERYKGEGWGLRQVLQKIDPETKRPLNAFVESAKALLTKRVENSPQEKGESRWLKGWLNRVDTYIYD